MATKLSQLEGLLDKIKANQAEADAEIVSKLIELNQTILDLKTQIGDADIPAGAEAKLNEALAQSKALADIIPNPPAPPA